MAKALSNDLRERVLAAIDAGMSARAAAARFGVSASSAIRRDDRRRREGDFRCRALGGDRRSGRIEAHTAEILALIEAQPDLTLAELQARLGARGVRVTVSSLWRFFRRHRLTRKRIARPVCKPESQSVLISLRQRIRSRELAHGQDGHPRVWSHNKDAGTRCHIFGRAFQTPIDCQAICTILPANIIGPLRMSA
jgi:transposase